jgi:hypothetical protein
MDSGLISLLAIFKDYDMFEESVPPKHHSVYETRKLQSGALISEFHYCRCALKKPAFLSLELGNFLHLQLLSLQ